MDATPKSKAMSKDDIICLIDIIQSRPIIISKETNASTNKHKEEAWDSVTVAFNARCGSVPRTKQQLKLKWDNLKKAARKRAQQIRLNHLKTGGGKPDFIPPDETLEKVSGLLGSTCCGFEVPFGGDGVGVVLNADTMMGDGNDSLGIEEVFYIDEGTPNIPKEDKNLVETPSKAIERNKKRLFQSETRDDNKFYFGTPMPKQLAPLKKKSKKPDNDGRQARNLSISRYYDMKTKKLELQIEILKLELNKKVNNS